jgi:NADPH-dependent ferric siderophore reductase
MATRLRREPPSFRAVEVRRATSLTPRLRRVTLGGPELAGLDPGLPAASVRLLLPAPGSGPPTLPTWDGNEFLRADGSRPVIRTVTPRRLDADALELDVDVVVHEGGPLSTWATTAGPGEQVAVSGTGRGYAIDPDARSFLLAGDETALPAIAQLLEALPPAVTVDVLVEISHPDARLPLPAHPGATVRWVELPEGDAPGAALVSGVEAASVDVETRAWVAGEAAAVQRIRTHLFEARAVPRAHAVVRGYWKHGRAGPGVDA